MFFTFNKNIPIRKLHIFFENKLPYVISESKWRGATVVRIFSRSLFRQVDITLEIYKYDTGATSNALHQTKLL
jgi:hypothetical protein